VLSHETPRLALVNHTTSQEIRMSEVPAAPAPAPTATPATYPGKTLGIVGLILAIFFSLIGLIVSIIAYSQSKSAGYKNTPAFVGIIIGAVFFVLGIIFTIIGFSAASSMVNTTY
jgi:hypothetical protein